MLNALIRSLLKTLESDWTTEHRRGPQHIHGCSNRCYLQCWEHVRHIHLQFEGPSPARIRMSPPCKLRAWRQSQKGLTPSLKTPLCQSLRPLSIETPGVEGIGEDDTRKQPSMAAQVLPAYELI
ncbi:hypothetical protein Y1Q_0001276 [Alligator mississippiensis]|uniref:Uncharacterized protein n=1 Tax=Alligator mississippiensis TaxID=8496 RepID=A0A151M8V5_ALLMI|nr:hypothetical protein Y1Q_0001276 [Alligator mississippiensis]